MSELLEEDYALVQLDRAGAHLTPQMEQQVMALSIERVEALGEALLDFTTINELKAWLNRSH